MTGNSSPLKFETERLKTGPQTHNLQLEPKALDLADDPEYRFEDPVHLDITLRLVGDTVLLNGAVRTVGTAPCARCLEPLRVVLSANLAITYMQDERLRQPDKYPELVDDDVHWYDGELIYPAEQIRELLLLELPLVPACELQPGDVCPVRNVAVKPLVFGPTEESEAAAEPADDSLAAKLRRLRGEMGEQG